MKSILVATDFSQSADNAMKYAASLAQSLGANLILLHVYQIPISMSDVPVLMVSAEELRSNADMGLMKSREMLEKKAFRDFLFKRKAALAMWFLKFRKFARSNSRLRSL